MDRRLALLFVLAAALHTGESIKCYMCTSANDPKCADPMSTDIAPTECSNAALNTFSQYFNSFSNQLTALTNKLGLQDKLPTISTKFSCSKLEFQDGDKEYVLRGCSIDDSCETLKKATNKNVGFCETCDSDLCNAGHLATFSGLMLFLMPAVALLLASS